MTDSAPRRSRSPKKPPATVAVSSSHFYVRTDVDNLLEKSDVLEAGRLTHTPFLAFVPEKTPDGPKVTVHVIDRAAEVAALPPATLVLVQWAGRWRSDFFKLTAGDVAAAFQRIERRAALRRANPSYTPVYRQLDLDRGNLEMRRTHYPDQVAEWEALVAALEAAAAIDPDADARTALAAAGVVHPYL